VTGTGQEIERKYLVTDPSVVAGHEGVPVAQRYLFNDGHVVIRMGQKLGRFVLGVKRADARLVREEFEIEVPELLGRILFASPLSLGVTKTRYYLEHAGTSWAVDVFDGVHAGLVVAEVELDSPDETVDVPPWCGAEVTTDPRYSNHELARRTTVPGGHGSTNQR
jgi:adenylate cyclase